MEYSSVGSILRSTQALCMQLCEKETLEYGIAYHSDRFSALPEANQFREVICEEPGQVHTAFQEVENWFEQRGLSCLRWAPAGGTCSDHLRGFLTEHEFRPIEKTALVLARWPRTSTPDDVRIVPARAARAAYKATFLDVDSRDSMDRRELLAEAYNERLDDPQYDAFVALVEGEPAGRCTLYQVGDIARVMDLRVVGRFSGRGVDSKLLHHSLALAKRLSMRRILAVLDSDEVTMAWFEGLGFVADGEILEFERDTSENRDSGS